MADDVIELPEVIVSPGTPPDAAAAQPAPGAAGRQGGEAGQGAAPGGFNSSSGQYFDQITRPPYLNRAVVVVEGGEYAEWTSVTVSCSVGDNPAYTFNLTTSEQEPWPQAWAFFRIKPADKVKVYLDGYLVIDGFVIVRQVAYNATGHTVQIQGIGKAGLLSQGAVASKTGEFKNQDLMNIAQSVAKPFGVNVTPIGNVPKDKFPRATVQPGERAWDFIERLSRQVGVFLSSNPNGDLVLMVGGTGVSDAVVEGRNILEGREHVSLWTVPKDINAVTQAPGNDDNFGAQQNQMHNDGKQSGDMNHSYMPSRVMAEMPSNIPMLKQRTNIEDSFNDAVKIEATVTLLGWRTPSGGGIWNPGQQVYIDAPMLILKRTLFLKRVVFTQDNNSGTRATLTLVNDVGKKSTE